MIKPGFFYALFLATIDWIKFDIWNQVALATVVLGSIQSQLDHAFSTTFESGLI